MKKTTSFHLEEDILNEIEEYKSKHSLSSRNVALERMLLERKSLMQLNNVLLNRNVAVSEQFKSNDNDLKEKEDKVEEIANDAWDSMPD